MGREQKKTELGGERVLLEGTETQSLAVSVEGYSNLRCGHLDTDCFGDGEVHQGINEQKWREILGTVVSKRNTL